MWFIFTAWLKGNLKWILGGLAALLAIGAFVLMIHNLVNSGRKIGQLTANLTAEREVRTALEADYQTLVSVLEREKQEAESTAAAANQLTKDITDASDQDRPVGPVLRRAVDGLRDASTAASGN